MSGHQGTLRSLFLKNIIKDKEMFISTGVCIAILVDLSRLTIHYTHILNNKINWNYVSIARIFALFGAIFGKNFIHMTNLGSFKLIVGISLILFGVAMILGRI
ncbi:MAG: hypothetical protein ABIO44_01435 [Saprospiraceae bacterium]